MVDLAGVGLDQSRGRKRGIPCEGRGLVLGADGVGLGERRVDESLVGRRWRLGQGLAILKDRAGRHE